MSIETTLRGLEFEYRRANPYRKVQIEAEIARLRAILARGTRG